MTQVLRHLPEQPEDTNLLVGTQTNDDAGIYKLTEDIALIQTVDFFTPIVDNPYHFGQIAAANALSDVYAMGGEPKTVLNIVGFSIEKLGQPMLTRILTGAADKVKEAGALVAGGHSIDDQEPKFGLSVTGIVHPDQFYRNVGARDGDALVLTKPIGTGIQTTAIKQEKASASQIDEVTQTMAQLNKTAARTLRSYHPHAVTDVTGFGLLGHASEMAHGSNASLTINHESVPVLGGTRNLVAQGAVPGGSKDNHAWIQDDVDYGAEVDEVDQLILCDAVTSGGLLVSLPKEEARAYVSDLDPQGIETAAIIGEVTQQKDKWIDVR